MRCLVHFYNDQHWIDFRYAELDALLRIYGVRPKLAYDESVKSSSPFLPINLPSIEEAQKICSRSVLIKCIYELWTCKNLFL